MSTFEDSLKRTGSRSAPGAPEAWMRIVQAGIRLFNQQGASVSIRAVAKEAGVTQGAVQHFYPTRDAVLAAIFEQIGSDEAEKYERAAANWPGGGESRLLELVDFAVHDAFAPETRRLFFNLAALSCDNAVAAQYLSLFAAQRCRRISDYIGSARPTLHSRDCVELATQILALLQGILFHAGSEGTQAYSLEQLARGVKQTTLQLLAARAPIPFPEDPHITSGLQQ